MNLALESFLLSMLVPAVALAVFILLERHARPSTDDNVRERENETVVRPQIRIIPSRKR